MMREVKQGDGTQEGITMGPCINQDSLDLAQAHVEDAVNLGAKVKCGGGRPSHLPEGHFFEPTLLAGATREMRIYKEETFAPVLPVLKCGPISMIVILVFSWFPDHSRHQCCDGRSVSSATAVSHHARHNPSRSHFKQAT
jgi:hypothetical protein